MCRKLDAFDEHIASARRRLPPPPPVSCEDSEETQGPEAHVELPENAWCVHKAEVPTQDNGSDCGVFVLEYILRLSLVGGPMLFDAMVEEAKLLQEPRTEKRRGGAANFKKRGRAPSSDSPWLNFNQQTVTFRCHWTSRLSNIT